MHLNGQGVQQGSSVRWSSRLRDVLQGKPRKIQRRKQPVKIGGLAESGQAFSSRMPLPSMVNKPYFGGSGYNAQSMAALAFVVLMHIAALYMVTRVTDIQMPAVSVPLMISFALNEPVQEKLEVKPKPKPQTMTEEAPSEPKPVEESKPQVIPPRFDVAHLDNPVPAYPALSQRLGEQGEVVLRVYVTPEGTAGQVHIHSSSGYPRLDRAAKETVERWKFMPARQGSETIGAWVLIPIPYILKG